ALSAFAIGLMLMTTSKSDASVEDRIFERPLEVSAAKAVKVGDVSALQRLIDQGVNVNAVSRVHKAPWGEGDVTLLVWAATSDNSSVGKALLTAGADPNKPTNGGMTPLMMAIASPNSGLFELLLTHYKADPNKVSRIRPHRTALTIALEERRVLGERRFDR